MTGPNEGDNQGRPGFARIDPAAINLTDAAAPPRGETRRPLGKPLLIGLGLGALLLAAAIVFFLLPLWVAPPTVDSAPNAAAGPAPPVSGQPPPAAGPGESPWQAAQQSELRRDTQEILERMLEAGKILREKGVEIWARQDYEQGARHAETGDSEYASRNFAAAREQYAQALGIFTGLVDNIDAVFDEAMVAGNKALETGEAAKAQEAFEAALAIDSMDRAAQLGLERAATADEVRDLIRQGDALLRQDQRAEAEGAYQRALALDKHSAQAQQQLRLLREANTERAFKQAMSSGFGFLEQGRPDSAQAAFAKALKLKPKSREARNGLEQARQRIVSAKINALLKEAGAAEAREDWQGAGAKYEAALGLDSHLANALEGKRRVGLRQEIHGKLEQILAHPARLFDRAVFDETVAFHNQLSAMAEPGPVLSEQLARLGALLSQADTPVQVRLQSDSLTRVVLYKVGDLGYFISKELLLRPGNYVAVGQREGYRDARVEFFVAPDQPPQPVVVQSREKIALGN